MDKVNTILPWKIRINHYSPIFSKILHLWFLLKYFWSWIQDLDLIFIVSGIYVLFGWYIGTRLKSYNLGQKCLEEWLLPCLVSKKNFLEYWQKKITHKVELWLDHFSPWLNNIDHQTWWGGGRVHGSTKSAEWVSCGWVKLFFQGCKVVNFWNTVKLHD